MDFITLELRPRLRSCNVFISMKEDKRLKKVEVKLIDGNLMLCTEHNEINIVHPFIKAILPQSLSSLTIFNKWICFRAQMKPFESLFGSFHTEIVKSSTIENNIDQNILNNGNLSQENEYSIHCKCCENAISKKAYVKRVLPLPSLDYDPSEWFCCKHHDDDYANVSYPRESDYLYGPFYSVLHKNLFENDLRIDKKTVICNRCLLILGKVYNNSAFRLWNCCIDYKLFKTSELFKKASEPVQDFLLAIKDTVNGTAGEQIILEAFDGNENHYITMKLMDLQLYLLKESKPVEETKAIALKEAQVVQILYRYETKTVTKNDHTDYKYCEVPFPVIKAGLEYLTSSTKRLPPLYRIIGDYYIGHLSLNN
ncbi:uncharacterized protein [Prorops nasuta]|uniref:uncharacterized protein n=1 Tax=Prorops nasuta TaxID=863751 RepID=UPI0034CDA0D1